jgi:transposase
MLFITVSFLTLKKEHTMMTYHQLTTQNVAGIDLHKNSLRICIMDTSGSILYQSTIKQHKLKCLKQCLAPYGTDVTIGVESTFNWYWLIDWCRKHKIPCVLGHAFYLKHKMTGKHKSDKIDAHALAERLRLNDFPCSFIYPAKFRATRDLVRRRNAYVSMRTSLLLHRCGVHDQYLLSERHEMLLNGHRKAWYEDVWTMLDSDQILADVIHQRIKLLDEHIAHQAHKHFGKRYTLLMNTFGVGPVIASTLLYEIYDIKRFKSVQCFSSYCRVVTPLCESSGKIVGRGNSKSGNAWLCWALHMLVSTSCRYTPELNMLFKRLKKKRNVYYAHRVIAHQWAVAIYFMLKNNEPFSLEKFLRKFGGTTANREPSSLTGKADTA